MIGECVVREHAETEAAGYDRHSPCDASGTAHHASVFTNAAKGATRPQAFTIVRVHHGPPSAHHVDATDFVVLCGIEPELCVTAAGNSLLSYFESSLLVEEALRLGG